MSDEQYQAEMTDEMRKHLAAYRIALSHILKQNGGSLEIKLGSPNDYPLDIAYKFNPTKDGLVMHIKLINEEIDLKH